MCRSIRSQRLPLIAKPVRASIRTGRDVINPWMRVKARSDVQDGGTYLGHGGSACASECDPQPHLKDNHRFRAPIIRLKIRCVRDHLGTDGPLDRPRELQAIEQL